MACIQNRYTIVYLFDAKDSNPNGDMDAEGGPRFDPFNGQGIVSGACLKRKIRDYILKSGISKKPGYDIYVQHQGVLSDEQAKADEAVNAGGAKVGSKNGSKDKEKEKLLARRAWMLEHYFDVRAFGAVMSTGKVDSEDEDGNKSKVVIDCGKVNGPVQVTWSRSIDPVEVLTHTITRVAQAAHGRNEGHSQIGKMPVVPYGLYKGVLPVTQQLAADTGFSDEDLRVLVESLQNMWELDKTAARPDMNPRKIVVFKHASVLGGPTASDLARRVVAVAKKEHPRDYTDYDVKVVRDNLPAGTEVTEVL